MMILPPPVKRPLIFAYWYNYPCEYEAYYKLKDMGASLDDLAVYQWDSQQTPIERLADLNRKERINGSISEHIRRRATSTAE